jgi:hypothetical protein
MLVKAVAQPLGTAKRVQENRWEMSKSYWRASRQFLKGVGKPLEMPKYQPSANRREGSIALRLVAITWQFPLISFEALHFCLY